MKDFILKGDICYSKDLNTLKVLKDGYLVCEAGKTKGAFSKLPKEYEHLEVKDTRGKLIIPGLSDLHMHAPQFSFRGLGMNLELLDWLNTHTFPEEAKYGDLEYAKKAYSFMIEDLKNGPNTRSVMFASLHVPATLLLMEMLDSAGQGAYVGKVNMDRNAPDNLRETDAKSSAESTREWLSLCLNKYENVKPILTPRFIPSCSDELMHLLSEIKEEYNLPVQSHLSENQGEIEWVKELCPCSNSYGEAYNEFGLFGNDTATIMAHCVWCGEDEIALMKKNNVFVAHCPQSNANLSSGTAPVRGYLNEGVDVGLGSDVAGGCHTSIFRAMSDAIQASKLYWRLVDQSMRPLSTEEAFYMGTKGGGKFFGKVGSFEEGYEFDALVIDESNLKVPYDLDIKERLERVIYLSDDRNIKEKYISGREVKTPII